MKKLVSLIIVSLMLLSVIPLQVFAASQVYYAVDMVEAVKASRIKQKPDTGDCAFRSVCTVEAYMYGATTSAEKNTVYTAVKNKNLGTTSGKPNDLAIQSWGALGYATDASLTLKEIYDRIATGQPVIVHRTAYGNDPQHWSVICGYKGSTTTLQESGFIVVDVSDTMSDSGSSMNLTKWKGKATIDRYAYRKSGVNISLSGIRMAINHPKPVHVSGQGHGVFGYITSDANLKYVTVTVYNASTYDVIYSYSTVPNAKSFNMYKLDSAMTFAKWAKGGYFYHVNVSDANGNTKSFLKYFEIGSSWPATKPSATPKNYTIDFKAEISDAVDLPLGMSYTYDLGTKTVALGERVSREVEIPDINGLDFTLYGFTAYRHGDKKWFTEEKGWVTQADIDANGYTKRVYTPTSFMIMEISWLRGCPNTPGFTFYAVWDFKFSPGELLPAPSPDEPEIPDDGTGGTGNNPDEPITTPDENGCGGGEFCPGVQFTDMPKVTNWAHKGIDYAISKGLMNGTSDTVFAPAETMNRAMLVTVLWRLEGSPSPEGTTPFTDLKQAWYKDAVAWAYENDIVNGISDTQFSPNGAITRQQMAAILYRYSNFKGIETDERADISAYPDAGRVQAYAADAMAWANAAGLITGSLVNGETYLLPRDSATRAQVATILMRYCDAYLG